ncbi:peptidyl-prolyl cis-trans isomerase [Bacillus sp. OV322]|uniref:peptidyl-prolyl cis-trans isomerase n=1 Tax=Bacillus sp. OV322 TaxID=1882764 RepID=UPI003529A082
MKQPRKELIEMESIVFINGKVKYQITLDPGVWIFDDRKIEIDTYFSEEKTERSGDEEYTASAARHWQKEIQEGATLPPTLKTERKFEKQRLLSGTFIIPFQPFLKNAEPDENASGVTVTAGGKEHHFTMQEASNFLLGFSVDGKPIKDGGPLYIYFGNGTNRDQPIRNVVSFTVK